MAAVCAGGSTNYSLAWAPPAGRPRWPYLGGEDRRWVGGCIPDHNGLWGLQLAKRALVVPSPNSKGPRNVPPYPE